MSREFCFARWIVSLVDWTGVLLQYKVILYTVRERSGLVQCTVVLYTVLASFAGRNPAPAAPIRGIEGRWILGEEEVGSA